jgi:hypothetical protein
MKSDSDKPGNVSDKLYIPEGTIITETLLQIIKFKQLNKVISEIKNEDPHILIDHILDELELKYEIPEEDLKNIPEMGGFITVSNHPYQGIDSMLLFKIFHKKRNDFKIMASFLLRDIEPLHDVIPVSYTHLTLPTN